MEVALRARDEQTLRRVTGFEYMARFLQGGAPHREVPEAHWKRCEAEGPTYALVTCQCGERPVVETGAYPVRCECQRWFFFDGTAVWALNSPSPTNS